MSLKNILSRILLISVLVLGLTGVSLYSIAALVKLPVFSPFEIFTNSIQTPEKSIHPEEISESSTEEKGANFRETQVFTCSITLTSSAGTNAQSLCINVGITSITYSIPGALTISVTSLPAGVTSAYDSGSGILTISGTPTVDGSFNYSIVPTGGTCDGTEVPVTGTISVSPDNTVTSAPVISPVCINTALTSFTHTTTGATGIGVATGLPAGVTAAWAGNTITISGTPTASGTFNYSIPLTGGCGAVSATGTFTVTPDNTVTPAPVISPVCINTALTSFTHTTTGATGIANNGVAGANGLPAGVSAAWTGNTITISGTPIASGTFNYSIPLTGGCGSVSATGTFTVTPNNTVTPAPVISPVCINTALTSFTHTTTGATGIGAATGLPAGVSAAWAGNTITISGTPTASGTFNYSIPLTGGCGAVSAAGTFTVTPDNTVTPAPVISPVCVNTALTSFTHTTTGATGIGVATGLPAGVSAVWAGNTITISGTPTASGTFNYSIPLTGGCGVVSATGTFTVTPDNTVTLAPVISPVCINTALTSFTHTTTGATGIGVATGLPAGVSAAWAGNTITISGTPTASGTFNYSIPLTGGCGAVSATGTFTVTPNNTVTPAPVISPVCINTALTTFTHTTTGATGIANNGVAGANGLPAGVSAAWAGNTITISGTPTASGTFNYSIPLTGGCNTPAVNATGTITVTPNNTVTPAPVISPVCINTALTSFTHTTTGATGIANNGVAGANGLPAGVSAVWAGNSITISGTPTASGTFNYSIPLTGGCNTPAVNATGTITVTPNNTVTPSPIISPVCINTALTSFTHTTTGATGIANNGVAGANGLPAGVSATWAGNTITISGTPTASGTFNYSIPLTGGCGSVNAAGTIIVNPEATVSPPSVLYPSVCINTALTPFTQTTTGVTSISNSGVPGVNGLPPGISATFNLATNTITFTGTATTAGLYNYSIPLLTGTCITGPATGTIEVSPVYTLTSVSSVSASSTGAGATVTINGNPTILTNGQYEVTYALSIGNGGSGSAIFNVFNGTGNFSTIGITNPDLTQLVITSIKKITDVCTVTLDPNSLANTTFFGICSAVFSTDGTFFVPANIYEITVKVWGGGGKGGNSVNGTGGGGGGGGGYSTITIPVIPGEPIAVYVGNGGINSTPNGGRSYVTRDSNLPYTSGLAFANGGSGGNNGGAATNPGKGGTGGSGNSTNGSSGIDHNNSEGGNGGNGGNSTGTGGKGATTSSNNSTVGTSPGGGGGGARGNNNEGANGGGGIVLISYSCPDANQIDCMEIIDDGSVSGTTVIRFNCNYTWTAPTGLANFSVWVGAGGGGGGVGTSGGGGAAGGVNSGAISTTNPYGLPAGTNFTVLVGPGGAGSPAIIQKGTNGAPSSVTGTVDGILRSVFAAGGGGGGSSSNLVVDGNNGGSGGGGAAVRNGTIYTQGNGGSGSHGGNGGISNVLTQGQQQAIAGGGGGGILGAGFPGNANGNGTAVGGNGGNAQRFTIGTVTFDFGAGGGGLGTNFNGNEFPGLGGLNISDIRIGGDSNPFLFDEKKNVNNDPDPVGQNYGGSGNPRSGSGGGAGYDRGGNGGSGVVYISFPNVRILEVEYLYFNAAYNSFDRSGELKWATSKEWESSHFEIERSINDTRTWTKVGTVSAKGYSDLPVEYRFTDLNLPASGGNIFYRLKQVDLDGDFHHSVTRAIQVGALDGSTSWIAYPNPSAMHSSIHVDLLDRSDYADESILIRISDGRGIFESYTVSSPEEVSGFVNSYLDQARPGLHILQLIWGNKSEQMKLIRK